MEFGGKGLAALAVVLGLLIAVTAVFSRSPVEAQLTTDFTLGISDARFPDAGEPAAITLTIDPGASSVAALGASITYDAAAAEATDCVVLVGLGSCSTEQRGEVIVQTVDPSGWATRTNLARVTFTPRSVDGPIALTPTVNQAYDRSGVLIAGDIADGSLEVRTFGDVTCDNVLDIGDALVVAQYTVGARTASECPLTTRGPQIDLTTADANHDGSITLSDAIFIARCSVGVFDCQA